MCSMWKRRDASSQILDMPTLSLVLKLLCSEKVVAVVATPRPIDSSTALSSCLLGWFAKVRDDERATMIQACYGFWLARNKAKDGKKIALSHEIMTSMCAYMAEWLTVHKKEALVVKTKETFKWAQPEEGWVKANADGAVSKTGHKGVQELFCEATPVIFERRLASLPP